MMHLTPFLTFFQYMYFPELLLILFVINSYFCEKPTTEISFLLLKFPFSLLFFCGNFSGVLFAVSIYRKNNLVVLTSCILFLLVELCLALVDAANDKQPEVREMIMTSLHELGKKQPEMVLSSIKGYLIKHQKVR